MAQMTLEELVRQLSLAFGGGLQCVAVYGSSARGEHVTKKSDINVLVLVDVITMERLRAEGGVARAWQEAGNPPPLTLTVGEWQSSVDIFPIEYADILAHHRVLHGALPTDGIRVDARDLRLQLEHEAMSKLLRLRHGLLTAANDDGALLDLLGASVSSILVLLRATLRLLGEEPPADSRALLDRVAARANGGFSVVGVRRVLEHARGTAIPRNKARESAEEYLTDVAGLVAYLDRYTN